MTILDLLLKEEHVWLGQKTVWPLLWTGQQHAPRFSECDTGRHFRRILFLDFDEERRRVLQRF